jgi:tetratricopeptide (TPR) repeat protein
MFHHMQPQGQSVMAKTPPPAPKVADLLRQGFAALQQGRPNDAAIICRKAISAAPNSPEAHFLVGLVALDLDDKKTAVRAFATVTKIDEKHAAAWAQLARLFMRLGQPARAEKALAAAVRAGVKDAPVADIAGVVSSLLGDQKQAKRWYQFACDAAPDNDEFAVNLATASMFLGETDEARSILENLLKRNDRVAQAQWLLSSIVKATSPKRADDLAARAAAAPPQAAAFLGYAAGKEFEDCGEWDKAFAAFDVGARAKRSLVDYDETGEEAMFAALHEAFTPDWAAAMREGAPDPSPIFVIGQPRTGTTLIERIITSHSMAESAGELQQFRLSVRRLSEESGDRATADSVRAWTKIDPKALGEEYLRASATMRNGAPRFVDKLPGNYLYLPLILAALPNARVVHLTRDPIDSCFASFKQLFADAYFHSYDQGEMARHHIRYRRLMDHWRRLFPERFLDVSYEETVADIEPQARRLIGFLSLPWEDACLRFYEQGASVSTASAVQVREQAHTRSVGRWRRYERQIEPMRAALAAAGIV